MLLSPPPGLGRRQSVRIQEVLEASKNKTIAKEQHAVDEDAMSEPEELDTMAATSVGFDLNRKNSASSSMGFTNCVFDKCVVCGRHPVDGREAPCGHVACCKCWLSYLQEQPDHQVCACSPMLRSGLPHVTEFHVVHCMYSLLSLFMFSVCT